MSRGYLSILLECEKYMGNMVLQLYHSKVKKTWKIAFFSTVIIGLLVHLYKFTNFLPNDDSLIYSYHNENMLGTGRWFLTVACGISSFYDLPWVNGILTIFWLALSVVVIIELFNIKNTVVVILVAGISATFPGFTETLMYEFVSDGYMLGLLLSTLAVFFSTRFKGKKYYAISILFLCLSCAIYQAYVSFAIVLFLCCWMLSILTNEKSISSIVKRVILQIVIIALALCAYLVVWKILLFVQSQSVSHYQGIDSVGQLSIGVLISGLYQMVCSFAMLIFGGKNITESISVYSALNCIFVILFFIGIVCSVLKTKLYKNAVRMFCFLVCIIALPFALCMWAFTTSTICYKLMMLIGAEMFFVLCLLLVDNYATKGIKTICLIVFSLIILNNALIANICYLLMNQSFLKSFSMGQEIAVRVEMLSEEVDTRRIAFVGNTWESNIDSGNWNEAKVLASSIPKCLLFDHLHAYLFIEELFSKGFIPVSTEELNDISKNEYVMQMKSWPYQESVKYVDGVIIVKLSE